MMKFVVGMMALVASVFAVETKKSFLAKSAPGAGYVRGSSGFEDHNVDDAESLSYMNYMEAAADDTVDHKANTHTMQDKIAEANVANHVFESDTVADDDEILGYPNYFPTMGRF